MKTFNHPCAASLSMIAAALLSTSCIMEAPGDRFYRTLWTTHEEPFEGMLIEFLCEDMISVQTSGAGIGSYGYYEHDKLTASFTGLTVTFSTFAVEFTEAHKAEDTLTVIWHLTDVPNEHESPIILKDGNPASPGTNYSTTFIRLAAYP